VPTIVRLRDAGARVLVTAHLGRPKGAPDPAFSLAPVAKRLGELLGADVAFGQVATQGQIERAVLRMLTRAGTAAGRKAS